LCPNIFLAPRSETAMYTFPSSWDMSFLPIQNKR
jgi:hypothetical protein